MIIVGASLTGLLASALLPGSSIVTPDSEGSTDHKAILRMRTNKISELTGIPFKKVSVNKAIWSCGEEVQPTPRINHMYSKKVTGTISDRSISGIDPGIRYIPPVDFQEQLKAKAGHITYSCDLEFKGVPIGTPIINTLSLRYAMEETGTRTLVEFDKGPTSRPIYINHFRIKNCNSYCTIYYPDPDIGIYRSSLNGDMLIIESAEVLEVDPDKEYQDELDITLESLGLSKLDIEERTLVDYEQKIGKMTPFSDDEYRKDLILRLTLDHHVYSLGRKATWRPKLLLEDTIEDINLIKRFIKFGNYSAKLHTTK